MITINDVTDDMVRLMLSHQRFINLSALAEMRLSNGNVLYQELAAAVDGVIHVNANEADENAVFIDMVICLRPRTDSILVDLGVLTFWQNHFDHLMKYK